MSLKLRNRIITSIFLFVAASFCILIDESIFGIANFLVAIICYAEWVKINHKFYYLKNRNKHRVIQYLIIKVLGMVYLFFYIWSALLLRGDSFAKLNRF